MRSVVALLFLLASAAVASAQSAGDYVLRGGFGSIQARAAFAPRLDGQDAALGRRDVILLCFSAGQSDSNALLLKVGERFYAINGTARDLARNAEMLWKSRTFSVIDPYLSRLEASDYMQRMIGPGNEACRKA